MPCCCPYQNIDWSKPGGLANCNWPLCVQFKENEINHSFRIVYEGEDSIGFESEVSPALPPVCLLGLFSLFPLVSVALIGAATSGYLNASTWTFLKTPDGLLLEERTKYICMERSTILLHKVCNAFVEHDVVENTESGERIVRVRLVVTGVQAASSEQRITATVDSSDSSEETPPSSTELTRLFSPWKLLDMSAVPSVGDSGGIVSPLDDLCHRIVGLIPEDDVRVDVQDIPAISHPRLVQYMIRGAVRAEALPPVVHAHLDTVIVADAAADKTVSSTVTVLARSALSTESGSPRNHCAYREAVVDPNCDVLTDDCSSVSSRSHSSINDLALVADVTTCQVSRESSSLDVSL